MPQRSPTDLLHELGQLADSPTAQARFAADLLARERRAQLVGPALAALERCPLPEARPALLTLYADLDADGVRRDAGGDFRAAALRALRPWTATADLPLLEHAVTTYEYLPPGRSEEAGRIRAAGLIALADRDPQLAGFHAARLLVDHEHTSRFSGEPARTAAEVLAALSESLPLYLYTLRDQQDADVTGACLRNLADAPDTVVDQLLERFGTAASDTAQISLVEMLLARPDRPHFHTALLARLEAPGPPGVFRYLALAIVAGRNERLLSDLEAALQRERDPQRRLVLEEALALAPPRRSGAATPRRKRSGTPDATTHTEPT